MMSSISRNSKQDVMELTWQNGQLALHELELNPTKSWGGEAGDHTLESIVNQGTTTFNTYQQQQQQHQQQQQQQQYQHDYSSPTIPASSIRKWDNNDQRGNPSSGHMHAAVPTAAAEQSGKRVRSESKLGFRVEESACASASAAFCRETDTTMMTWNSFESPRSLKNARLADDDSLYQDCSENQDGEGGTKGESCRSQSSARRSRAAAIHNLSERRRRDRINEKMKALQKLVPNASKTDKASMLDEVIEYLKQLQAQIHMMSNARNMPQMVMPNLGMQQQLQMSILARMGMGMNMGMGMGMGMGMLDVNNMTRNVAPPFPPLIHATAPLGANTSFVSPPPFAMPTVFPPPTPLKANVNAAGVSTSTPNFSDAYNTFLAQSMNMEFLNKMSALYRQQSSQQPSKKSLPNNDQGG